ncbi:MAG: hypothetical protein HPY82_26565 [Gammaproteobacteria bacterium]|nr:hypothetical protein [Gammaproteobacteria bacterium]
MSSRTLSAYFDDYRQGRKDIALLRDFLLQTFRQDPVRRGHLLHWLDQAQYEHPIPVTDFLLLRKEVEYALKSEPEPASGVDPTLFAEGVALSPESVPIRIVQPDSTVVTGQATLVANNGGATIVAPRAATGTDVTRIAPQSTPSGDYTPIPERSDHAGLHEAATSFDPARQATLTAPAPLLVPAQHRSRLPLLVGGSVLGLLGILGGIVALQYLPLDTTGQADATDYSSSQDVNRLLQEAPTGSVGTGTATVTQRDASASAAAGTDALDATPAEAGEDSPPQPDLATLNAATLLALIRERVGLGLLLPADDPATAHGALRELEQRFAGSEELITARKLLKDTHLKLSDEARGEGRWEAAQQHLDAAFDVLQPHSVSATAPSTGS